MMLKDFTFVSFYVLLLIIILGFFTIFFFGDVVSKNGVEIVKQYLINVAMVDPTVADIIKAAKLNCRDDNLKPVTNSGLFTSSTPMYVLYGLAASAVIIFALHTRFRFRDHAALFTKNEVMSLSFLLIPVLLEIILYYFVYVKYKYYSNVYLVKLMKNMRIRADLSFLTELYSKNSVFIDGANKDGETACQSNCLDSANRKQIVQSLRQYLQDYNRMLDVGGDSELAKLEPASTWQRVCKLPGKLGMLLSMGALAFVARAVWELNMQNRFAVLSILIAVMGYIIFMYALKLYISSGKFKTIASSDYITRLFCQTDADFLSKLLKKNLVGKDLNAEVAALKGS